jgi:hypothetical protein
VFEICAEGNELEDARTSLFVSFCVAILGNLFASSPFSASFESMKALESLFVRFDWPTFSCE